MLWYPSQSLRNHQDQVPQDILPCDNSTSLKFEYLTQVVTSGYQMYKVRKLRHIRFVALQKFAAKFDKWSRDKTQVVQSHCCHPYHNSKLHQNFQIMNGLFCIFYINELPFFSPGSFRFTAKVSRKYREFQYTSVPSPVTHNLPTVNNAQSAYFTLEFEYSQCYTFYKFRQIYYDMCSSL